MKEVVYEQKLRAVLGAFGYDDDEYSRWFFHIDHCYILINTETLNILKGNRILDY